MEREKMAITTGPDESVLKRSSVYTERQDDNGEMPLHDIVHKDADMVKDGIQEFNSK